jgi:hypothetical protein
VSVVLCGGAAAEAASPRAELRGLQCRRAADPAVRMVAVTAVMGPVGRTARMELKFDLERRAGPAGGFRPVVGRQLGQWLHPANSTLGQNPADVWILKQNVVNLSAPAWYRFRVWFRWMGAGARVLRRAVRTSPLCFEPETQPDLVVGSPAAASYPWVKR